MNDRLNSTVPLFAESGVGPKNDSRASDPPPKTTGSRRQPPPSKEQGEPPERPESHRPNQD